MKAYQVKRPFKNGVSKCEKADESDEICNHVEKNFDSVLCSVRCSIEQRCVSSAEMKKLYESMEKIFSLTISPF